MSIEGREGGHDPEKEKQEFRKEFLDVETKNYDEMIEEQEEYLKRQETGEANTGHNDEQREEEGKWIQKNINFLKEVKSKAQKDMSFRVDTIKMGLTTEQIEKRFESNIEKIKELKAKLENTTGSRADREIVKIDIKDLEQENRIISAIQEGKL